LRNPEPIWKSEDHPELAQGADVWVRKLRQENEERFVRQFRNSEEPPTSS
jgi:hypothetical protein